MHVRDRDECIEVLNELGQYVEDRAPDPCFQGGYSVELEGSGWFLWTWCPRQDETPIAQSNRETLVKLLSTSEEDQSWTGLEVMTFGHWGWGSISRLFLPSTAPLDVVRLAADLLCSIEEYAVLDDDRMSELEEEAMAQDWGNMGLKARLAVLEQEGTNLQVSLFSIRRDAPEQSFEVLRERLYRA